jgi:hypothetical protein
MATSIRQAVVGVDRLSGWDVPADFELPTAREIELELALDSDSWRSLLATVEPSLERAALPVESQDTHGH